MELGRKLIAVKRFIEVQIKPGETYNFTVIQDRFDKVLTDKRYIELSKYRIILEGINKSYKKLIFDGKFEVSDWYIEKLREFIINYKIIHPDTNKIISEPKTFTGPTKIEWHFLPKKHPVKIVNNSQNLQSKSKPINYSSKYFRDTTNSHLNDLSGINYNRNGIRKMSGIPIRGYYFKQTVPIDEFGCVVVCDEVN
jgi:hypothetical protein